MLRPFVAAALLAAPAALLAQGVPPGAPHSSPVPPPAAAAPVARPGTPGDPPAGERTAAEGDHGRDRLPAGGATRPPGDASPVPERGTGDGAPPQ